MTRVFCFKHEQCTNAYPERMKPKKNQRFGQIKYWQGNCGCTWIDIEDITIHVRWFLKDGTELISKTKKPQWEIVKPK